MFRWETAVCVLFPNRSITVTRLTDENGAFTLSAAQSEQPNKGTTPGDYYVTVTRNKDEPSRTESTEFGPIKIFDSLIPKKYNNQNQSGLKATVERKRVNEFNFDLQD